MMRYNTDTLHELITKPYTYFIYNKITLDFYIGSRNRNVKFNRMPSDDLWRHYFTSSKLVESQIQLFGSDAFVAEVIYVNKDSDHEATYFWYEQQLIKENIDNPLCLNQKYFDPALKLNIFKDKSRSSELTAEEIDKLLRGGWEGTFTTPCLDFRGDHRSREEILAEVFGLDVEAVDRLLPLQLKKFHDERLSIKKSDTGETYIPPVVVKVTKPKKIPRWKLKYKWE